MGLGRRWKWRGREADDGRWVARDVLAMEDGEIFHAEYACFATENESLSTLKIMWVFSKRAYTPGVAVTQSALVRDQVLSYSLTCRYLRRHKDLCASH